MDLGSPLPWAVIWRVAVVIRFSLGIIGDLQSDDKRILTSASIFFGFIFGFLFFQWGAPADLVWWSLKGLWLVGPWFMLGAVIWPSLLVSIIYPPAIIGEFFSVFRSW